jgi:hypothetical protein
MTLTPFLVILLKDNYIEYRKWKAVEAGDISPEMQTRINLLNSQLAIRPHIQPELINPRNKMLVHQINLQKSAQRFENQQTARGALNAFLRPGSAHSKAHDLKEELEWLAGYMIAIGPPGIKWIPGPLKKVDKAMSKTTEDYDFIWSNNKDLVRGTLACRTNADLQVVSENMTRVCDKKRDGIKNGMFLVKAVQQKSVRDGGQVVAGYSGWNFVIQFKEHKAFPAEMQANTYDVLYGKHSKKDIMQFFNCGENEYKAMQMRLKLPGGLGHALYDIQDIARSGVTVAEGNWARELALDYYDACRGTLKNCTIEQLNERIATGGGVLVSAKAKELWKHAVEEAAWPTPIAH